MTASFPLSVHHLPFTVCYPLTIIRDQWLMANGKCMACPALNPERSSLQSDYEASRFSAGVNGKWLMVNGSGGAFDGYY